MNEIAVKSIDGSFVVETVKDKFRLFAFKVEDFLYPFTCSLFQEDVLLLDPSNYEETHADSTVQLILPISLKGRKKAALAVLK